MTARAADRAAPGTPLRAKLEAVRALPATVFPHETRGPEWAPSHGERWSAGFVPGLLLQAWRLTDEHRFREAAESRLERIACRRVDAAANFDLGFLFGYAFALHHALTGDAGARAEALAAAERLSGMIDPEAGVLAHRYDYHLAAFGPHVATTIIDAMMNLGLLWWAAAQAGDESCHAAARRHADTVARWFGRADGSFPHHVNFDTRTGRPIGAATRHGAGPESRWTRGLAWGLYGFMIADAHAPEAGYRGIWRDALGHWRRHIGTAPPPWDLDAPAATRGITDSSALAIVAAALSYAEAAGLAEASEMAGEREAMTDTLMAALRPAAADGLIGGQCNSVPVGTGIGGATIWGDYFALEALTGVSPFLPPASRSNQKA